MNLVFLNSTSRGPAVRRVVKAQNSSALQFVTCKYGSIVGGAGHRTVERLSTVEAEPPLKSLLRPKLIR